MSDWTVISSTAVDAESPVDEDLTGDLNENVEHLFESAIRSGPFSGGIRTTMAAGTVTDTGLLDGGGDGDFTQAIVFATDSDLGDPNFSAAPIAITFGFEESGASSDWGTLATLNVDVWIDEGTPTADGFTFRWKVVNGPASSTVGIILHFMAIGLVTSGE